MKICFIADTSSLHTYRWVTYFAKKGHEISIISLKKPVFDYKGIDIHLLKKIKFLPNSINFPFLLFQLWKIKRHIKPNVFHALGSSNGWLAAVIGLSPLIITFADPGIFSIPYIKKLPKIYKILNKYSIKKAKLLVCDGWNVKRAMINLGADLEKIKIVRYGIDLEKFKPLSDSDKPQKDYKVVISTKPLRKESDVETLIKAVPEILKAVPKTRFIIIGDGDQKENLINLAEFLKVSDAINFTGNVSSNKIPSFLNSANTFVNTSLIDTGLASSTAEAMACEIPMVVSDSGDNRIWIEDEFIFSLKDSHSLASKVIYLLKNEDFKTKIRRRKVISEINDYSKEMKKMEKLYLGFSSLEHPHRPFLIDEISSFQPRDILEIGCGYGPNLFWLSKKFPNAKIRGIDINPKIIKEGKKFLKDIPNVNLVVINANEINYFGENSFDIVFSDAALMYVNPSEIKEVIQKMIWVAKKAVILVDWHSEEPEKYNSHIGNWTRNYRELFGNKVHLTKIKEEMWPNKDWIKFGYIIKYVK